MEHVYYVLKSFVDPIFIIFFLLFIAFIVSLVSNKKKGNALLLFFILLLLYGGSIPVVSNFLSYKLEKKYIHALPEENKEHLDVIAALSAGVHDIRSVNTTFPAESTLARLAHAVRMYKDYNAKYLVCMGTSKDKVPDAEVMAKLAQELGVPKERIRIDVKSRNTYEHAVELNRMFVDKHIKIGVVTSAYHMQRSEKEFKKFFSNVRPLPCSYLYTSSAGTTITRYIPQSQPLANNAMIFKEYAGQLWYSIKDI